MNYSLEQIAEILNTKATVSSDAQILGVSTDSRTVKSGQLFFALRGDQFDGHGYLEKAMMRGAAGCVVSRDWLAVQPNSVNGLFLPVSDPLAALQELAKAYRQQFKFPVIAITGSNGKTTTKDMMAAVLSKRYRILKTKGNLNNHIGLPLSICGWGFGPELAILEMGTNHFGEIKRLCEIAQPTHGLITNIGKGHIGFFHDLAGVARAKGELIEALREDGIAFLNGDDPFLTPFLSKAIKTITFGFDEKNSIQGEFLRLDVKANPSMSINGKTVKLSIPGRMNLYNALAAVAAGLSFNVPWEDIREALESFRASDKRMAVEEWGGVTILNDAYNANPTSVKQAFETLISIQTKGRRIAVLGDMLELGELSQEEHRQVGQWAEETGLDALYTYGSDMHYAAESAKEQGLEQVCHFKAKMELIEALKEDIRAGDSLLVKGSRGMQMEEVIEGLRDWLGEAEGGL